MWTNRFRGKPADSEGALCRSQFGFRRDMVRWTNSAGSPSIEVPSTLGCLRGRLGPRMASPFANGWGRQEGCRLRARQDAPSPPGGPSSSRPQPWSCPAASLSQTPPGVHDRKCTLGARLVPNRAIPCTELDELNPVGAARQNEARCGGLGPPRPRKVRDSWTFWN